MKRMAFLQTTTTLSRVPHILLLLAVAYFNLLHAFTGALNRGRGEAQISHSGPTNALYGNEIFNDNPAAIRDKRAAYFGPRGMGFNNAIQNNNWGGLLLSAEAPNEYLKLWILSEHNRYRQMVPASDMRMVYWSEELAASAQRHANTCDFRHSRNRVNIGENIWAAPYTNYSDAVQRWFNEVNDPYCQCNHAYKHCCGHYIQVVWSQTNLVGCGYARCRDVLGVMGFGHRAVFVCHYNPQGNKVTVGNGQLIALPAFKWGQRCSDCPSDAPACYQGLCYMPLNYQGGQNNNTTQTSKTSKSLDKNTILE